MELAMKIWPEITIVDIRSFEENGKMRQVLEKWGLEGGTTKELLSMLRDINRMDVLNELKKDYPFVG